MATKSTPDQKRLDEAIERADDLLVTSLQQDERRRGRRRLVFVSVGILILGGMAMSVVLYLALVAPVSVQQTPITQKGTQLARALDDPEDAGRLTQEGWNLWQHQQINEAAEKFEKAVKLDPKNVAAWNGLGWASFSNGNHQESEKAFEKVIALEPNHPAALNGLGQVNLSQRRYKDAEKYLLKAAPQASAAWYGLAKVYLLTGKYDEAAKWAEKIINSGQADPEIHKLLAAAKKRD